MSDSSSITGRTISHYRIVQKIGGGGMGVIYEAEDLSLGRHVALKFLPDELASDAPALERFQREARAASALNHPNICVIHEIGQQDGVPFIVMELMKGKTLGHRIEGRPLPVNEALDLAIQVAEGLEAAHAEGIVHRDIKPANIFVTARGQAKILDFGLAKQAPSAHGGPAGESAMVTADAGGAHPTAPGTAVGTVAYMSPEQVRGELLDARSDLFSFGVTLYEMVTGTMPFRGQTAGMISADILNRAPVPPVRLNPEVPGKLEEVISKALEKDRKLRYQNAADLRADLQRLKRDSGSGRTPFATAEAGSKGATKSAGFRRGVVAGATILVMVVAVGCWLFFSRKAHALTDKDTIVLADFTNTTGDTVFDGTLRQGLSVQLEQSPFLSVVSDQRIQKTLQMMDQKPDVKLTPEIAREICQRTGSAAVLDGSIAQIGTQYLLTLKAVNCASAETMASTEAQASDKNRVLEALGKVSVELRNKLGESLSTVQKFDTPLEQATTPSLEALKAFSSGLNVINTAGSGAAIPFFKHAIELDPKFALAYAYLGILENDILEPTLAASDFRKAYELRGPISEAEKYSITATYEQHVNGNIEKAIEACRLWIQAYPRAYHPHDLLAGAILPVIGQYEQAVEEATEAMRLYRDYPVAYSQRIFSDIALDRVDDAKATYQQALEHKLSNPFFNIGLYEVAFLQNDAQGMAEQVRKTTGLPGFEDQLLSLEADTAAFSGRLNDARELTRRAMDSAERAGEKEPPAAYSATCGLREAWFGNGDEARRRAAAALSRSASRDVLYLAALALAYSREDARAQAQANDLGKRFPEDTIVQFNYLPTLRARLALNKGNASQAIASLKAAAPYELGGSTSSPFNWTPMYPVFVRGEAYLATRQGREAAAEFQKILDHRGLVLNQPIGVLAHLGLARAYVLQGDKAKAGTAYQDFLTLWKDADPDIPVLRAARAEYAKLQ